MLSTNVESSWLSSQLDKYGLSAHDFETTGRGLRTLRDRAPGDVVIAVSQRDGLTASSLIDRFPEILGRALKGNSGLKLSDEQVMSIGLLLLKWEENPYVSSLPERQYSVLEMPDSILNCLPRAYQKIILAYRNYVQRLYESLLDVVDMMVSFEDFRWAFATVRSRCVGMEEEDDCRIITGGERRVMLPAFDLLNHKFEAQAVLEYSSTQQSYVLKTNDAYTKGDQIFISYGERDNLNMLMTYGFCTFGTPDAAAFFDIDDLLSACSLARPIFFPELVQNQLRGLVRKLGKERDVYGLDGKTGEPRKSLQVGLTMMADIEKQFLVQCDESFLDDVFKALLSTRKAEIQAKIEIVDRTLTNETSSVAWIPILRSIRTLLREELDYLSISQLYAAAT